jgi:cell division septal protein FtsQ
VLIAAAYVLGWTKIFVVEKVIIDSSDKKIVADVMTKINQAPAVVTVGEPLARVDRREIASRLRELVWVENVQLDRRMLSGELRLKILPRNPIGRLVAQDSSNIDSVGFMDRDLEFFYLPREAVARAVASGETGWATMPELSLMADGDEVRGDVRFIIESLQKEKSGIEEIHRVTAKDQESISTTVTREGRKLDISWGSVKELELKVEVMNRLLELKANKRVNFIDLSNPIAPIVK